MITDAAHRDLRLACETQAPLIRTDEDDFEGFLAAVDDGLTRLFGPDHQAVLARSGPMISGFVW